MSLSIHPCGGVRGAAHEYPGSSGIPNLWTKEDTKQEKGHKVMQKAGAWPPLPGLAGGAGGSPREVVGPLPTISALCDRTLAIKARRPGLSLAWRTLVNGYHTPASLAQT